MSKSDKSVALIMDIYEASIVLLFEKAANYEIKDYDDFITRIEMEAMDAQDMIRTHCPDQSTALIDYLTYTKYANESREKCSLQVYAQNWLEVYYTLDSIKDKPFFVNDKNQISDEYGNPLSLDGEHRVFEIIKGGKSD